MLAVVSCQTGCGNADLVEVWVWFRLSNAVEVFNIDELEIKEEAGIRSTVLRPQTDMWQIAELLVAPVVQLTYTTTNRQTDMNEYDDDGQISLSWCGG